jgi:Domain of unknown function (DUF2017)
MSRRFSRRGEAIVMSLSAAERELLSGWVAEQLRTVYESEDAEDQAHQRLFPVAYLDPTEEDAESEWQELVHPELLRDRLDNLARVVDALGGATEGRRGAIVVDLGPDDVPALLGVLNDARLALGTRLGVTDETDVTDLDPSDPSTPVVAVYGWLTYLEGELVEELLGGMPG